MGRVSARRVLRVWAEQNGLNAERIEQQIQRLAEEQKKISEAATAAREGSGGEA